MKMIQSHDTTAPRVKLHTIEKVTIFVILFVLIVLFSITTFNVQQEKISEPIFLSKQRHTIDVFVMGDVAKPGIYRLPKEIELKELLELAEVNETADLRRYRLPMMIKQARLINVPKRVLITVHIKGAIKGSHTFQLPKGAILRELIPYVEPLALKNADLSKLDRKRKLKDNEWIEIKRK